MRHSDRDPDAACKPDLLATSDHELSTCGA